MSKKEQSYKSLVLKENRAKKHYRKMRPIKNKRVKALSSFISEKGSIIQQVDPSATSMIMHAMLEKAKSVELIDYTSGVQAKKIYRMGLA